MSGGHAHYVIVDHDGHRVWSRHRGANSLCTDLLRGPESMIEFIREQKGGTRDFWMNSVWWQGVVLLDLRRRRMLVQFVDETFEPSLPEIRAWLRIVSAQWPRWEVAWAARGLHEVMDYLGLPYDTVLYLDDPPEPLLEGWWGPPSSDEDPSEVPETLIAVRDVEGRLSFGSAWILTPDELLLAGPDVLLARQEEATGSAVLEVVPHNGLYVDAPGRRVHWWATLLPLDPRALDGPWRGWTLTDHGDAYEEVAALIGPDLLIDPPPDPLGDVVARLEAHLTDPGLVRRVRDVAGKGS